MSESPIDLSPVRRACLVLGPLFSALALGAIVLGVYEEMRESVGQTNWPMMTGFGLGVLALVCLAVWVACKVIEDRE